MKGFYFSKYAIVLNMPELYAWQNNGINQTYTCMSWLMSVYVSGSRAVEMRMFPTLFIASFNFEKYDSF